MKTTFLKKVLGLFGFAVIGLMVAVTSGYAQNLPMVGFLFSGRSVGNTGQATVPLVGIRYTGECPGEQVASARSRFYSKTTRPAPELRAVIRNVTFGFPGETKPFTDREYFNGDVSEDFDIRFGDEHKGRFLAVRPGENQFEYEIKRGNQVLESGGFTASFEERTIEQNRSARNVWREKKYCRRYDKKKKRCIDEDVHGYYERTCGQ
ncbi:hypothetical protein Q2T42_00215 [Leptolyngbya boryana CZ1]|uniref:Uncharacterized protein n=1 Tax=Leptolyngbya boryana CZ1 TaxID=3060204 RepID=A0AA96X5Y5_LEPBY|nr:hypothetical protein [Leptolyngbya boryana]WNZ46190.1 hypothetical protein Q2T42_30845 [Leptolyngbya boryana CZ1]WNZ46260.1 hypothetical protein Q2T42_00215 [Leptolyngbya boryana CZ1]